MSMWNFISDKQKLLLEKRTSEKLILCNAHGLYNLPIKGQNSLDISKHGEYLLATSRKHFCLIDVHSHLYSSKLPQNYRRHSNLCCCDTNRSWARTSSFEQVLTKPLNYKSACTASLWYPVDNSIFLTAGDCIVDVWDILVPEIAYTFSNLPSTVKCIGVSNDTQGDPLITAGLSCGMVSICDVRSGTVNNLCRSSISGEVTSIKFIPQDSNRIIAAYNNSSVLVWDIRLYNKPIYTLKYNDQTTKEHLIIGCTIRNELVETFAKNRNLKENHSYDFATENDVWKYIKDFNDEKAPKSQEEVNVSTSQNKRFTTKPIKRPSNKYQRLFGKQRKMPFVMSDPWYNMNDMITPRSTRVDEKTKSLNALELERGFATDIQFADDGFNMYISRVKGYIDCYDYKTFRFCKSIDTNEIIDNSHGKLIERRYSQQMRIQLIRGETHIIFNVLDHVGVVDAKTNAFHKLIRLDWVNSPQQIGGEQASRNSRAPNSTTLNEPSDSTHSAPLNDETYVTDIATLPFLREIFATNNKGDLFIIHPDYKRILDTTQ